jgi:hypothetical protein
MRIALLATLMWPFLVYTGLGANAGELPEGWRLPMLDEMSDIARNDSPSRYAKAVGDFNGDGVVDEAVLLKSTGFSGEALWVWLSNTSGGFSWLKLDQVDWGPSYPNVPLAMGIAIAAPGIHPYGCFCGARDCNLGPQKDRPKLKLRDPAIEYFKIESAGAMYFWSRSQQKFLCVVLSD